MLAQLFIVALSIAAPAEDRPLLVFSGNAVINEEVYRAVLDLPEEAQPTPSNARLVRARLLAFLRRAGYELSAVKTKVEKDQIRVEIDEGRVDKIIVLGQGTYHTLRVKLDLSMPYNVFNRPVLERQLKELAAKHQFETYRFELVPVQKDDHVGPQIVELPKIQDIELISPPRPYELHISFSKKDFQTGFAPEIVFNSLEGVGLGGRFRLRSGILEGARWESRLRVAATLRENIAGTTTRPVLSRAYSESKWYSPPIIGQNFRTLVWLRADLLNRRRRDLGLESFFHIALDASVNAEYQFLEGLSASLGAGVEHRRLFAIDPAELVMVDPIVDETPDMQTRPFAVAAVDMVFTPNEVRRDRKSTLSLEGRGYLRAKSDRPHALRLQYSFQAIKLVGWHELWLRSRGASTHGDSLFPDEIPIGGNFLRGPFVDTFYVRRIMGVGADLRVSLVRDLFKVSIFHDLVGFGLVDRAADRTTEYHLANAFGGGVHWLIIDAFQFDLYYGVGFAPGKRFDHGLVLSLQQAF